MFPILLQMVLWTLAVDLVDAERIREQYLCTPDECVKSDTIVQVGIKISSRTTLNLLPGTYTSESPAAKLLPTSESFLAGFSSWSAGVEPYGGSAFYFPLNSGSKSVNTSSEEGRKDGEGDGGWPLIVTGPAGPTTFTASGYASTPQLILSNITSTTATSNTNTNVDWESLYLPPGVYFSFPPPSSSNGAGGDERYRNVVFRGSVPMRQGLGREVRSLDLSLGAGKGRFGSDACFPACGPGGSCLPSTTPNQTSSSSNSTTSITQFPFSVSFTCTCLPGFTGPTCDQCLPGHYGPACQPCPAQCYSGAAGVESTGRCDDGFTGTGGCLGVLGNSTEACECLHGTCTSGDTCECSAGWADANGKRCSVCAPGFFLSEEGDCQACPLGTLTCRSSTRALTCSPGYSINAGTGSCVPSGGQASCTDGQFWDGSACARCSPACTTCTGSGADQCLECASPRFNLNGTCVGYDGLNGICDSSSTDLKGVYVANNAKGRCEACPSGCLACAVPSFSITSVWNDTVCTACQEGWVLQSGKCVEECQTGFFLPEGPPNINGTCEACDQTKCASCHTSATQCSSCIKPGEWATVTGDCVASCPSGTTKNDRLGRCVLCPSDCASCSEDGLCLSCSASAPILAKGRCSAICPVSSYWEASTALCTTCASNGTSCIGPEVNQCVSCANGAIMKDGTCMPTSCTFVDSLGICLRSDLSKETLWWPYLLVVLLLLAVGLTIFWWIRRSRRLRRENTAAFAATLDDTEIERRVAGLGGIFKMLNSMRMRTPARESFHIPDLDGPPPAYNDKGSQPVFSITPPSPTAQGPLRAPANRERHDDVHHGAFENKRERQKQVSFDVDESSWLQDIKYSGKEKDDGSSSEKVRAQHCMV